jgi:lysophospholipase L1-like esterase
MTTIAPTRYPRRQRSLKIVSVATGCAIGLLCGEIGARTFAWLREASKRSDFERMRTGPSALRLDREAKLGEIVCPSAFDDVIYELIPSCSALFQGVPCSFNADGYRGPPLPARKREPGSLRIVGLGDSVMFGWGIDEPDCFLRRIERTLRARMPERLVEVVNTGVPGYNTAMEVAAFEHKTLSLRPDVILIDWVGNDADLPNLVATDSSPFDLSRSFLYDLTRKALGWRTQWQTGPLQEAPFTGEHYERDPARVPTAYRGMVGEAGVERALRRLAELAEQHGFRVVVTSHYGVPEFVRQCCQKHQWPVLDSVDQVHAALRERGLEPADYRRSDLVLGPEDPHPSARAHAMYAERLANFLQQLGWLAPAAINPR